MFSVPLIGVLRNCLNCTINWECRWLKSWVYFGDLTYDWHGFVNSPAFRMLDSLRSSLSSSMVDFSMGWIDEGLCGM